MVGDISIDTLESVEQFSNATLLIEPLELYETPRLSSLQSTGNGVPQSSKGLYYKGSLSNCVFLYIWNTHRINNYFVSLASSPRIKLSNKTVFRVFFAARYPVDSRYSCVYIEMGKCLCRPFSVCINAPTTW